MSNPFAQPAPPGDGITWGDLHGRLLLIEPSALELQVKTKFGDNDAVRADVTVLDGDEAGEVFADTLIFPKLLVSQTKSKLGEKVLGRLGQGEQKSGQSPPWLLEAATEQDVAIGVAFLNKRSTEQIAQPAGAAAGQGQEVPF